jgi:hypothetical protein
MGKSEDRTLLIQRVKELAKVEDKGQRAPRFANHWTERDLDSGIRAGTIKLGNFAVIFEAPIYINFVFRSLLKTNMRHLFKSAIQCVFWCMVFRI